MTFNPEVSPAGDRRERAVPCSFCRTPTLNIDARCSDHRPLLPCPVCNERPTQDGVVCSVCSAFDGHQS